MRVSRTVDVDDLGVYEELKRRAARDRRTLKAYVNLVLERHCGMSLVVSEDPSSAPVQSSPERQTAEQLRDLVNAVVAPGLGSVVKTGADLRREQDEARRRREYLRTHPEEVGQDMDF